MNRAERRRLVRDARKALRKKRARIQALREYAEAPARWRRPSSAHDPACSDSLGELQFCFTVDCAEDGSEPYRHLSLNGPTEVGELVFEMGDLLGFGPDAEIVMSNHGTVGLIEPLVS